MMFRSAIFILYFFVNISNSISSISIVNQIAINDTLQKFDHELLGNWVYYNTKKRPEFDPLEYFKINIGLFNQTEALVEVKTYLDQHISANNRFLAQTEHVNSSKFIYAINGMEESSIFVLKYELNELGPCIYFLKYYSKSLFSGTMDDLRIQIFDNKDLSIWTDSIQLVKDYFAPLEWR